VTTTANARTTRVRYSILAMLFLVTAFSYGDRVVLSIAGVSFSRDLHLDALHVGYIFSAFSWAYVAAQLPAGGLLDRYGAKRVYGISIICWSLCAFFAGLAGYFAGTVAFFQFVFLRLLSGLAPGPVFPGNGRIVAAWFPTSERGLASAIFNSSQYFAVVLFAPTMGWIAHTRGWKECFWLLGVLGIGLTVAWYRVIFDVKSHPRITDAEVAIIEQGGGLCLLSAGPGSAKTPVLTWNAVGQLLSKRMLIGIYLGQYCINTLTWFFLAWFPLYLSQSRHMSITDVGLISALPALCGSIGGISGGAVSDTLLRRGHSLTLARKLPIIAGMSLSMTVMLCNYINTQTGIVVLMSIAFFGKGFGALGWTVISDTSPKGMIGLNGGVFNLIGNLAGISTPIVIGYLVQKTGSYHDALLYVGASALLAIVSYGFIVGNIRRLEPTDFATT
jgi:ACS family glucarate transporter-like MFS transporter